jgi:hypothetical protein
VVSRLGGQIVFAELILPPAEGAFFPFPSLLIAQVLSCHATPYLTVLQIPKYSRIATLK